ncbi:MAG: hypothetical protein HKN23_04960 [Verrucomicrobiales bacterium]|nr:hypothetical protein [Verrucomicrobiales bacterium]
MKRLPNILLIDHQNESDLTEAIAKQLAPHFWVYVSQRGRETAEDSPDGVRYLPENPNLIEHFGLLDLVIVIGDDEQKSKIESQRDSVAVVNVDPVIQHHPDLKLDIGLLPHTVVQAQ